MQWELMMLKWLNMKQGPQEVKFKQSLNGRFVVRYEKDKEQHWKVLKRAFYRETNPK